MSVQRTYYADVAELADAQDLKSCGRIIRAGSIPAICTKKTRFLNLVFFFIKFKTQLLLGAAFCLFKNCAIELILKERKGSLDAELRQSRLREMHIPLRVNSALVAGGDESVDGIIDDAFCFQQEGPAILIADHQGLLIHDDVGTDVGRGFVQQVDHRQSFVSDPGVGVGVVADLLNLKLLLQGDRLDALLIGHFLGLLVGVSPAFLVGDLSQKNVGSGAIFTIGEGNPQIVGLFVAGGDQDADDFRTGRGDIHPTIFIRVGHLAVVVGVDHLLVRVPGIVLEREGLEFVHGGERGIIFIKLFIDNIF